MLIAPVLWWDARSWRDGFVPPGCPGTRCVISGTASSVWEPTVSQPLSVYYYLEPGAVYAPLFAYSGGIPWAKGSVPMHPSQGRPNRTSRRASSPDVSSTSGARWRTAFRRM